MERHPSTRASCLVQKLLEDSGNQRPMRDLELSLLCESLFSEQQKLKQVLDWAHAFLSGGSEVHSEFCRAESLMLAEKEENSPLYESSCETTYHYARCTEGGNEIFEGRGAAEDTEKVWKLVSDGHLSSCAKSPPDTPFIPLTSTPGTDKVTQQRNVKSMDASDKQTLSQSDKNNIFTASSAPYLKKESNRPNTLRTKAAEESETPGHRVETKKGVVREKTEDVWMQRGMKKITEEQESSPEFAMSSKKTKEKSEFEMTQEKERKTPSQSHLEIPQTLTVYEQYQCCVDQLHRLRLRQRKQLEPARETQSSEQTTVNPDVQQLLCENERKNPADNHPIGQSDASKYIEKMETLDHVQTKDCDKLRDRGKHKTCLQYDGKKCYKSLKEKTESETSIDYFSRTSVEQLTATLNDDVVVAVERTAAITVDPGPCLKTKGKNQGLKHHQSSVRGQRKKAGSRGASLGLYEKSNSYMHLLNKNEILQRPLSSQVNRNADAHTLADQMKASSDCKATHTTLYDNPTWKSAAVGAWRCEKANCKYRPAGVAVNAHWLSLPDEVWLSVLSLLPLRDLSRVMQVCRRLHTLATDHTLWRDVKVENSTLTEQWFLLMCTRRPRSLSLYSCSGPSLSFRGLGRFFTQCRNSLEVKLLIRADLINVLRFINCSDQYCVDVCHHMVLQGGPQASRLDR
ncbi:uncharacterized protein LOC125889661 [Xyrichtys novacula]|uniref:Uncharacterized protein LOC125889661 n=1 Tax=Xyrichtys novacula TaxID=13765 RepID=A0AAV1G8G6_XYRNO|nr:uncharacterized protein LOC125889661 [Xyrichtys novacula]